MRALPKQIQKQVAEADAMLAANNTPAAPQVEPVQPAEPVQAPAPIEAVAVPAEPPAPSVPASPPPADDAAKWEARYKTLQGMHNQNIGEMKSRLKAIEQQNQEMSAKLAQRAEATTPTTPDPKDAEVFGADLVEMVQRVAEQMFGSAAKAFDDRIKAIEQSLKGTNQAVVQTAEEMFLSRLKQAVPDYEQVNTDEGFLAWLSEIDEVYGVERQEALTAAGNALDSTRVARIFNAYKATKAPPAAAAPAARPATSELNRQVAPSTAAPVRATVNTPQQFTVQQVQAFYHGMQTGKFRGREAEAAQYEAAINQALAEGRITG